MELITKKLSDLTEYANNPRQNDHVVDKMVSSIGEYGFAVPVIVNSSGEVIDGHLRLKAAREMGMDDIPCIVADHLTDDQVRAFRLLVNRSVSWADWDSDKLAAELRELNEADFDLDLTGFTATELKHFTEVVEIDYEDFDIGGEIEMIQDEMNPKNEMFSLRTDTVFDSSNELEIPDLLPDMMGDAECVPDYVWDYNEDVDPNRTSLFIWRKHPSTGRAGEIHPDIEYGILGFYVDDFNFEQVWEHPDRWLGKFKNHSPKAFCTPDFSLYGDHPYIFQAYQHYRARWCGRYWQELGHYVIPNLTFTTEKTYELACMGIPHNTPVVICQCRTQGGRKNDEFGRAFFLKGINYCLNKIEPEHCIIYGARNHRHWIEPNIENKDVKLCMTESLAHVRSRKYHGKGLKKGARDTDIKNENAREVNIDSKGV